MAGILILCSLAVWFIHSFCNGVVSADVGVCYGRKGNNLPPADEVVKLYIQKGIKSMRVYDDNLDAIRALSRTDIGVIIAVPEPSSVNSDESASAWVRSRIADFPDVNFRYISVGNDNIPGPMAGAVLRAMKVLQRALNSAGLQNRVKVSTAVSTAVLRKLYPPSASTFSSDALQILTPIVKFLRDNNAPLLVHVYPYFICRRNKAQVCLDFALFSPQERAAKDNHLEYDNLFDSIVDSMYSALEKVSGGEGIPVVVSETGWPSGGQEGVATTDNAKLYIQNLIKHVKTNKGTPKRPQHPIEAYIFAMFDENEKDPPETEKHYGLFHPNMTSKYEDIQF